MADARAAIAWVRTHAAGYGAEPGTLFVTGSSAGANLAIRAVCGGETGITGLICRYGYYGDLAPGGDMPPMLVVHGEKDILASVSGARAFAERVRAVSSRPVIYAELPGAHHARRLPGRVVVAGPRRPRGRTYGRHRDSLLLAGYPGAGIPSQKASPGWT